MGQRAPGRSRRAYRLGDDGQFVFVQLQRIAEQPVIDPAAHDRSETFRRAIQRNVLCHRAGGNGGENLALLWGHREQSPGIDDIHQIEWRGADKVLIAGQIARIAGVFENQPMRGRVVAIDTIR